MVRTKTPFLFLFSFLFLLSLASFGFAACPSSLGDYSKVSVNPFPSDGFWRVTVSVHQPYYVCTFGLTHALVVESGDPGIVDFLTIINGTGAETFNMYNEWHEQFVFECNAGSEDCWASFDFYNANISCDSPYTGFVLGSVPANCTGGDLPTVYSPAHPHAVIYHKTGTWQFVGSGATETCISPQKSRLFYNGNWGKQVLGVSGGSNALGGCFECTPSTEPTCNVLGHVNDGDSFMCNSYGRWVSYLECLDGGWDVCGFGSAAVCLDYYMDLRVADTHHNIDRVTMLDSYGRELLYDTDHYTLFNDQEISVTAFEFLKRGTQIEWPLAETDQVFTLYSWNATEATCNYEHVLNGSYTPGEPFYTDVSKINCSLNAGKTESNVTLFINANMTSDGLSILDNSTVNQNFTIRLVSDIALLDNFQVVYFNSSHLALTGHFVKLSDLSEINPDSLPKLNISIGFYRQGAVGNMVWAGNFQTAPASYTAGNYLYELMSVPNTFVVGDVFKFNATVFADGYANTTYLDELGNIADYRVLYFKCVNVPKNTTYDFDAKSTESIRVYCSYTLANVSAMSMTNLTTTSNVTLVNQVNFNNIGSIYGGPYTIINETYDLGGPYVSLGATIDIPLENAVGYVVHNAKDDVVYVKNLGYGGLQRIWPGRYVGRWAVLSNPAFLSVKSYVDLVVEPAQYQYFNFVSVECLSPSYAEGDDIACQAKWYDPYGIVSKWVATFEGDTGYSYSTSGKDVSNLTCPSNSTDSCIDVSSTCLGGYGNAMRLCTASFVLHDAQTCLLKDGNVSDSKCMTYKTQLFSSGGVRKIKFSVTLLKAEGLGGSETKSATTNMIVTIKSYWDLGSWVPWWGWILLVLLVIIVVLRLIRGNG